MAIARALINEPKILLADEPTGNLDSNNAWEIMKLLDEINKRGTTVLVVSHNMEIVEAMKKRVITLQQGHVVSDVKMGGDEDEKLVHLDIPSNRVSRISGQIRCFRLLPLQPWQHVSFMFWYVLCQLWRTFSML